MISNIIKLIIITVAVIQWGCTTPEATISNKKLPPEKKSTDNKSYVHVNDIDIKDAIHYGKNKRSLYKLNQDFSIPIFIEGKKYFIITKTPYYNIAKYALIQESTFQPLDTDTITELSQTKTVTLLLTNNLKSQINIASVYMKMYLIRDGLKVNSTSVREPIYNIGELTKPGVYKIVLQETGDSSKRSKLIPFSFRSFK
jgi:hypothetical protein